MLVVRPPGPGYADVSGASYIDVLLYGSTRASVGGPRRPASFTYTGMTPSSGDLDDNLAKGATLTDVGERLGHLIESKGAVDVDIDVA